MPLQNNLKAWREAARLTIEQVAERVDVSGASISRIEGGMQQPRPPLLAKLCALFGQAEGSFYAGGVNFVPALIGTFRVPLIDYVQAGNWRNMLPSVDDEWMLLTEGDYSSNAFALKIVGDSMLPRFKEGDVVIIDADVQPRPNDFVVASNGGDDAVFKQYKERGIDEQGRKLFELVSLNDGFPSWRSDRQQIDILGTMMEHRQYSRTSLRKSQTNKLT